MPTPNPFQPSAPRPGRLAMVVKLVGIVVLIWIGLIVGFILLWQLMMPDRAPPPRAPAPAGTEPAR